MEMPKPNHQVMIPSQQQQLEEIIVPSQNIQQQEKKQRPNPEQALKCPRCASSNTKFCYYNNYSLSQPRYFCKGCRRYWTQGGSLRNVPVGGGCRKNKRPSNNNNIINNPKKIINTNNSASTLLDPHQHSLMPSNNAFPMLSSLIAPPMSFDPSELTLAFANNGFVFGQASENMVVQPNHGFLDILRNNGYNNGNNNSNGLRLTGNEAIGSTSSSSCKELDHEGHEGKNMVMGYHQWQFNNQGDYGCSSWQGIMNSSLM